MTDRIPLDDMTSDALDALYAELEGLRQVARGYCPACGRGDTAPTVEHWEQQKQRADEAERQRDGISRMYLTAMGELGIAINRLDHIRGACEQMRRASVLADGQPHTARERGVIAAIDRITQALDEPAAEQPRTTPNNPPGSTREQLPTHLLTLITLPPYLSTACQTADALAVTAELRHPLYAELRAHAERLHARCRLNNKFTGVLCACGSPPPAALTDSGRGCAATAAPRWRCGCGGPAA